MSLLVNDALVKHPLLRSYPRNREEWDAWIDELNKQKADIDRQTFGASLGYTSTTTLAEVKTFNLLENTWYQIECELVCYQNLGGFKFRFVASQTLQSGGALYYEWQDQTGTTDSSFGISPSATISITTTTADEDFRLNIICTFHSNATDGGTMSFQAAQVSSSTNTTHIRGGSSIVLREQA